MDVRRSAADRRRRLPSSRARRGSTRPRGRCSCRRSIVELVLVLAITAAIRRISALAALGLFFAYAALNGLTIGLLVMGYTSGTVATAFVSAAGMFGAAAVYGAVTKRSLATMGGFLFMGLIGLFIAMIVNLFIQSSTYQLRDLGSRRRPLHRPDGLGHAAHRARRHRRDDGFDGEGRRHRRAGPLPRLHQPVPVPPAALRRGWPPLGRRIRRSAEGRTMAALDQAIAVTTIPVVDLGSARPSTWARSACASCSRAARRSAWRPARRTQISISGARHDGRPHGRALRSGRHRGVGPRVVGAGRPVPRLRRGSPKTVNHIAQLGPARGAWFRDTEGNVLGLRQA